MNKIRQFLKIDSKDVIKVVPEKYRRTMTFEWEASSWDEALRLFYERNGFNKTDLLIDSGQQGEGEPEDYRNQYPWVKSIDNFWALDKGILPC